MPSTPLPERRAVAALSGLTVCTGLVDATSYLGIGHVFTANMTGNIVFLGFALGGAPGFSVASSLFALGGFLAGALAGGRMVPAGSTMRRAGRGLALEAAALAAAAVIAAVSTAHPGDVARWSVLALLGIGMGLQNAAVRRVGVPEMTTTVLTMTLTGIAADSRFAGGGGDPRVRRRLASVALMLGGATVGAALERHGLRWPVVLSVVVVVAGSLALIAPVRPSPAGDTGGAVGDDRKPA